MVVDLPHLGRCQRFGVCLPESAGITHRFVQPQAIKVISHVVMALNRFRRRASYRFLSCLHGFSSPFCPGVPILSEQGACLRPLPSFIPFSWFEKGAFRKAGRILKPTEPISPIGSPFFPMLLARQPPNGIERLRFLDQALSGPRQQQHGWPVLRMRSQQYAECSRRLTKPSGLEIRQGFLIL